MRLSGTGTNNLNWKIQNDKKVKIDNSCATAADVKYSVIVVDSAGNEIDCDPRIINK